MRNLVMVLATSVAVAAAGASAGCMSDTITGARPVSISISSDVSIANVGQDVTFTYSATGTDLRWVGIDFGDSSDRFLTPCPAHSVEVRDLVLHAYSMAGTYLLVGEAIAANGTAVDTLTITIN